MTSWRLLTRPVRLSIASGKDCAGFAKRPAPTTTTENCPHQASINVSCLDVHTLPVFATVCRVHQVSSRLVFRLQFIEVDFAYKPSVLIISKEDVAQDVAG